MSTSSQPDPQPENRSDILEPAAGGEVASDASGIASREKLDELEASLDRSDVVPPPSGPMAPSPGSEAPRAAAFSGMTPVAADGTAVRSETEESLPDELALTPEDVEDEAVRGDFMIRWAVLLIGVLLGCTYINDSALLVRIRTGEYMQGHGFLPPRTDVFSVASEGQPWYHLSWLLDHVLTLVYHGGGPTALTLLTAVGVGVLFHLLSRTMIPGISSWWGSVCAALVLVCNFNAFTPGPPLVLLLGVAATGLILHRWSLRPESTTPWSLVPLFWIWSQCDPNAAVGLALLIAFGLGQTFLQDNPKGFSLQGLWTAIGLSVLACAIHPFHWHVYEYPWTYLRLEQPETREYFVGVLANSRLIADYSSLLSSDFRAGASVYDWFGVGLIGLAIVAQLLNWRRLHWGWLLVFVAANAFALGSSRYLPMASVVNAIVATLNGQIWFRHTFRQSYSTDRWEVLFSRGGRAVTVLALFALAYLSVNGSLMGAGGRRVGLGFHPDLVLQTKSMEELAKGAFDDRPFHVYLSQGDHLIWTGRRSFVDSRMAIHARTGAAAQHREARASLIAGRPSPDAWKEVFDRFKVSHVIVRTVVERDVMEVFAKLLQRGWFTSRLAATGMVAYRPDLRSPEFEKFRQQEPLSHILRTVFRDKARPDLVVTGVRSWPRSRGTYDRWLIQPKDFESEGALTASQYGTLLEVTPNIPNPNVLRLRTGLALQTIREARSGLFGDSQNAKAYRRLGLAALALHGIDTQWLQAQNPQARDEFWLRYAIGSYYSAQILDPSDFRDHQVLADLCFLMGARDWALHHMEQFERKLKELDPEAKLPEQQQAALKELREFVDNVRKTVRGQLGLGGTRMKAIQQALQDGCWRFALELYEEDITAFGQDPNSQDLIADMLLIGGRLEESWTLTESMETSLPPAGTPGGEVFSSKWRNSCSLANLMIGNEERSIQLWTEDQQSLQRGAAMSALSLAPLVIGPPPKMDLRPLLASTWAFNDLQQIERETQDAVHAALADLVCSRNQTAAKKLTDALERNPETVSRVRIVYYLSLLTDEPLEIEPPSLQIPTWGDMFAEDTPADPMGEAPKEPMPEGPAKPKTDAPPAAKPNEEKPSEAKPDAAVTSSEPEVPAPPPKVQTVDE